jgi:hypothetical protein
LCAYRHASLGELQAFSAILKLARDILRRPSAVMRTLLPLRRDPAARAMAQIGFIVATFIGLLFFVDQLGATGTGKHVRTGVQTPTGAKVKP